MPGRGMIDKEYGKYVASCNVCGDTLPPEDTLRKSVKAARVLEWKNKKVDGEYENICVVCGAVKLLGEYNRMCKAHEECHACPLGNEVRAYGEYAGCMRFLTEHPSASIRGIKKWVDAHPKPTYLSDFLQKHPRAKIDESGIPFACASTIGYVQKGCHLERGDCAKCWHTPL